MMYPYPFYKPPYFRRQYYPKTGHYPLHKTQKIESNINETPCFPSNFAGNHQDNFTNHKSQHENCKNYNNSTYNFDEFNNFNNLDTTTDNIEYNSTEYFEILGLKLHFDDLLIIALLFFLYQENVKDTYLYIALILLLLS